jgi:flagellar assembly factor FliW
LKTKTKYFGEIEYTKDELISFPTGLFGFEDEQSFLLLPFSDEGTLLSLQSVRTPQLAFTLMHPFTLAPDYAPVLREEELKALAAEKSEDLYYYVMCTVKEPVSETMVNMRCPLAINPDTREGMQVILDDETWEMRHRLAEFEREQNEEDGKQEETSC